MCEQHAVHLSDHYDLYSSRHVLPEGSELVSYYAFKLFRVPYDFTVRLLLSTIALSAKVHLACGRANASYNSSIHINLAVVNM